MRTIRRLALAAAIVAGAWAAARPAGAYEPCEGGQFVADVVSDAGLRQRIVDTAVGEWRRFGFQVLDLSSSDAEADLTPLIGFSPTLRDMPPDIAWMAKGRLMRIGMAESEFDGMSAVRTYWGAVTMNSGSRISVGETAWSSAFMAWVMCRAGLSDARFNRRDAHVLYVAAAFRAEAQYGDTARNGYAYVARPADTPVHPGDLSCFSTAQMNFEERRQISLSDDWASRDGQSHCDIIVGFSPDGHRVLAIGGNVAQSVTMSVFAARREGHNVYLLPQSQWPQARPFYGIMQLRARPDLADRATIAYARPPG